MLVSFGGVLRSWLMNLVFLAVFTVDRGWGGSGDRQSGRCVMRADTVNGNCTVVGGMDGYLTTLTGCGGGQVVDGVSSSSQRVYRS
jgi:hypothetical protein